MNFSYEEIFSMYGQYDTFVMLDFHCDSEAYKTYKPTLMGTFIYDLHERGRLQQIIQKENMPRTNKNLRFSPSSLEKLSSEQLESLDRKGFQNVDIGGVSSLYLPRQNRFIVKGKKDIPNTIEVKFDSRGMDLDKFKIGFYNSRLRNKYKLIPEEEDEYFGLQLYYNPDQFDDELKKKIIDEATKRIKEGIRYYQLKAKFFHSDLTENEDKEFKKVMSDRSKVKIDIIAEELKRSTEKLKDLAVKHKDTLRRLIHICSQFENEVLVPYEFPIWWDFERFIHIYIRHVKETKLGERFAEKTIFQYKLRDIRRIIDVVIKSVYNEIRAHFNEKPNDNFRRMGTRSVYYDGIYYRLEIEPTGRLITFHPYNDNEKPDDTPSAEK